MIDTIVSCLLMTMGLGAHLFLHNDKLGGAIEFQKPMEAVDPATENSICEAGVMHKQDRNDSAKFYDKNCHDDRKKRGFRLIAVRVFTYT